MWLDEGVDQSKPRNMAIVLPGQHVTGGKSLTCRVRFTGMKRYYLIIRVCCNVIKKKFNRYQVPKPFFVSTEKLSQWHQQWTEQPPQLLQHIQQHPLHYPHHHLQSECHHHLLVLSHKGIHKKRIDQCHGHKAGFSLCVTQTLSLL